jgi:hypothetical protein
MFDVEKQLARPESRELLIRSAISIAPHLALILNTRGKYMILILKLEDRVNVYLAISVVYAVGYGLTCRAVVNK